jgi:N-acetyl-anhydromuramyl-L-alanine amidase AmpD
MGNRIIIAGNEWPLGDPEVEVITFKDPGGFSFYQQIEPTFVAKAVTSEEGETRELVTTRRVPGGIHVGSLGGGGWENAGKVVGTEGSDPIKNLRKVVHAVVLHHDGSMDSPGCYQTLLKRGYSTHFMVNHDGKVYQLADVADQTVHATSLNNPGIGIDLNNIASDFPAPAPVPAAPGGRAPSKEMTINESPHRSWTYTEAQYKSVIAVLRVLVDQLQIPAVFPVDEEGRILDCVLEAPPPQEFRGILCHWHIQPEKWDPGPGLDWERILAGLRLEEAAVPAIPSGVWNHVDPKDKARFPQAVWQSQDEARKAVTEAFKTEAVARRVCAALSRAAEVPDAGQAGGGFYPMGVNQTWHGGIHLPCKPGTIVRPILKGELVAAHLVSQNEFPPLGSNNFVLLRHKVLLPPRKVPPPPPPPAPGEPEPEQKPVPENWLTVYTLYMHLAGVDWTRPPPADLSLLTSLYKRAPGFQGETSKPPGPILNTLSLKEEPDQVKALRAGWVGLFSSPKDESSQVVLSPKDGLGYAGEFGDEDTRSTMVHLEVFTDERYQDAMELALYGDFLEPGPDEPDSGDLRVRSADVLSLFEAVQTKERPSIGTDKVLGPDAIESLFAGSGASDTDPNEVNRAQLRRMIVRHVSEWSDQVHWVKTLLASNTWASKLTDNQAKWVFQKEVLRYLPYIWFTREVSEHCDLTWDDGRLCHFHPVSFLLWWLYRRSAVRGKSVEAMLDQVRAASRDGSASGLSTSKGVAEGIGEVLDIPGQGEWQM